MRRLSAVLCLSLAVLLGSAGEGFALPPCPGNYSKSTWLNCIGTHTSPAGTNYVGEWWAGEAEGRGILTFPDGREYVGEFRDGKRHGQGIYTYASGTKYVGEWKDEIRHGLGTLTSADGRITKGMFEKGKFQSARKVTPPGLQMGLTASPECPGNYNKSNWTNCIGTYTYASGARYVGNFRNGKFYGHGAFTFASGAKYVGEFRDGKRHGRGTLAYANGAKYVGEFRRGQRHGLGIHTYADERVVASVFENGKVKPAGDELPSAFQRGLTAFKRSDFDTALREWTPLAEQGYARAQYYLGVMHQGGLGVSKDYVKTYAWWTLAAAQGEEQAQKSNKLISKKMSGEQINKSIDITKQWENRKKKILKKLIINNLSLDNYKFKNIKEGSLKNPGPDISETCPPHIAKRIYEIHREEYQNHSNLFIDKLATEVVNNSIETIGIYKSTEYFQIFENIKIFSEKEKSYFIKSSPYVKRFIKEFMPIFISSFIEPGIKITQLVMEKSEIILNNEGIKKVSDENWCLTD